MKLRIAAAVATGVALIGILAWPLAASPEPSGAVSLHNGTITLGDAITLAALAFLAGLIAYFISWPYGREIGILAVPSGLAIWAVRSSSMASLMQSTAAAQRHELFGLLSLPDSPACCLHRKYPGEKSSRSGAKENLTPVQICT